MANLQVGDLVLTVDENKELVFSPVIVHLHRSPNETTEFIRIHTDTGISLTLSPQHLVYRKQKNVKENDELKVFAIGSPDVVFASDVRIGDLVLVHDHYKGMVAVAVVHLEVVVSSGLYSPLTYQGNIVVDNVLASCYSDFDSHELQHFAFLPIRLFYRILDIISSKILKFDVVDGSTNKENDEVFWYGQGLHVFSRAVLPWKLWER